MRTCLLYRILTIHLLAGLWWGISSLSALAQLSVSDNYKYEQLVKEVFAGDGVIVKNVNFSGAPQSIGYFDGSQSNLGMGRGLVLTTGSIFGIPGPNISNSTSTNHDLGGDGDLQAGIDAPTYDAVRLEYDFIANTDKVTFKYIIASEEYNDETQRAFADALGIFVSRPGFAHTKNVALLPDGRTPATIHTINEKNNSEYYIDNIAGTTVEYDGFSVVLTATISVIPFEEYHIKFALADVEDKIYDTAIFLEALSFSSGDYNKLVADIDVKPVGCNGFASLDLQVKGGKAPFQYAWSIGANTEDVTNIPVGEYSVIVVDAAGSVFEDKVHVGYAEPLEVNMVAYAASCMKGGAIDLTVSGGMAPYRFEWSNGFETEDIFNLIPGNYSVKIQDASGCVWQDNIEVRGPKNIQTEITHTNATCATPHGSAQIKVNGGTAPYNYYWHSADATFGNAYTQDLDQLPEGIYYVVVTDVNGCTATDSVIIGFVSSAMPQYTDGGTGEALTARAGFCEDGALLINLSEKYSNYLWSNGETTPYLLVSEPGTYFVKVEDLSGCVLTAHSIEVFQFPTVIAPELIVTDNTLSTPTPAKSYQWYLNGLAIPGATDNYIIMTDIGEYSLHITDINGCQGSATYQVTDRFEMQTLQYAVYPNPTAGKLTIDAARLSNQIVSLSVIDALGKKVIQTEQQSAVGRFDLQLEYLPAGVYTLQIIAQEGNIIHKVMKE